MSHDRRCPNTAAEFLGCPWCAVIEAVRGEEKQAFNHTWKTNLPLIARRNYEDGYRDRAERRPSRYDP